MSTAADRTGPPAEPGEPVGAQGGFPPPPDPPEEDTGHPAGDGATDDAALGTNTMAVLGLVFAFLLPVLGLVFSAAGLVQTRRRGQPGRRLAAAGLAVSLVLVTVVAVLLAVLGPPHRTVPATPAEVPGASSPVPAGDPADEAVVAACAQVMPAMARLETDLGAASTLDEVADRVTALRRQVSAAAAASRDAGFAGHAQALADDFGRLVDAARAGGDPAAVVGAIQQDGMALGQDCGAAGWLP